MLLWEKKIGLVYLLSVLINGKLFKKFMQKWLPKKYFSLNVRKCYSQYFNLSSLTSIVKLNSTNIKRNVLAAIFALGSLIVMRS